jgi:hypothetical protein
MVQNVSPSVAMYRFEGDADADADATPLIKRLVAKTVERIFFLMYYLLDVFCCSKFILAEIKLQRTQVNYGI